MIKNIDQKTAFYKRHQTYSGDKMGGNPSGLMPSKRKKVRADKGGNNYGVADTPSVHGGQ